MSEKLKKHLVWLAACAMVLQLATVRAVTVFASSAGDVVINEVAWAGSLDSSSDEWIELYNMTGADIDLNGWMIEDDGASTYEIEGVIPAHGYFLIEDSEKTTDLAADAVIGLSLANAGDSLILKDADGGIADAVNSSGAAWYAGDSGAKASMERIDPNVSFDILENWATASAGNGSTGRDGAEILGTPGSVNSNYGGSGPEVSLSPDGALANLGDRIEFAVRVEDAADLYAYGFDIRYDSTVFNFVSAEEGEFLRGGEDTAFNFGLENGQEGTLIIGSARLVNPPEGIDGSGELFTVSFEVISDASVNSRITFGGGSYIADSNGDVPGKFKAATVNVGAEASGPVNDLGAEPGDARYAIELSWKVPAEGSDSYLVMKAGADGVFVVIGETEDLGFVDADDVVPGVSYSYRVVAVKDGINSAGSEISASEDRGLRGDNDRSDRVDGRDIENLARAYGSEQGDVEYEALIDTNYDGVIDGSDLIDIGASFGLTY